MEICAGVVLFNPNLNELRKNIESLFKQVDLVVCFDNGSNNIDEIKKSLEKFNVKIISSKKNVGIATALNEIMRYSKKIGYPWVLSMDQDASLSENSVHEYLKYTGIPNVGIICPEIKKNEFSRSMPGGNPYIKIERCPTSGMVLKSQLWEDVGGYDDDFFIDYVDYDMCIKAKIAGYEIIRVRDAFLFQNLGKMKQVKFILKIGKLVKSRRIEQESYVYNHSPKRNYYFVRNSLVYINKYKNNINVNQEYRFIVKWELKKILFEPLKGEQLKSIFNGIKDSRKIIKSR